MTPGSWSNLEIRGLKIIEGANIVWSVRRDVVKVTLLKPLKLSRDMLFHLNCPSAIAYVPKFSLYTRSWLVAMRYFYSIFRAQWGLKKSYRRIPVWQFCSWNKPWIQSKITRLVPHVRTAIRSQFGALNPKWNRETCVPFVLRSVSDRVGTLVPQRT